MKVLVCGDVHLTNYSAFNHPTDNPAIGSRLEYILKALDDFFTYGWEHKIHYYVINGDLFDQRQRDNPSTLAVIRQKIINEYAYLKPIDDEPFELYLNVGNHDEYGRTPYPNSIQDFSYYNNNMHKIYVFNEATIKELTDSALLFVPYDERVNQLREDVQSMLEHGRTKRVPITIFAHLGINGATQGRWNHRLASAFNLDDIGWNDPRVKAIALNHFHTRQTVKKAKQKEAWYVGDLTELNFNDIQKNGYGAPRGFDEIDTVTGQHQFIDLTKDPYKLPTFNSFDLDYDSIKANEITKLLKSGNYVRATTKDKDTYDRLKPLIKDSANFQLVYQPTQPKQELDLKVNANTTDSELVKQYCHKYYPEVEKEALEYLRKAKEN